MKYSRDLMFIIWMKYVRCRWPNKNTSGNDGERIGEMMPVGQKIDRQMTVKGVGMEKNLTK